MPTGTAPGDYHLQFTVTTSNGKQSTPSMATVRVLPPAGYYSDVDPDGMFELDANGDVTQNDAGTITKTPGADTVPDFGVPSLETATASSMQRVHPSATVHGPFDPHNPTPGVIAEIKAFKAAKNVGCDFVVDYDNALHDPTRGVIAARGTYQIFAYCTPPISYVFNYGEVGHNLNTSALTYGQVINPSKCLNTSDQYDGLFICTGTSVVPIIPTSGHAEYFMIIIQYVGVPTVLQQFPTQATFDSIPINSKGVVYPKINASSLNFQGPDPSQPGIIPFPNLAVTSVTPPGSLHSCPDMGYSAATGCVARGAAANNLRAALESVYNPPNYTRSTYTPHHIQPVCWGGNNSASNGVFLLTTDPLNLHAQFTAWWQKTSFSPDGTSNPQPPSDDDC